MKCLMFYDAELASMNPFSAQALKQVMDDKIAERFLELFNSKEYTRAKSEHPCAAVYRQFEEYMHAIVYPIRLIEELKTMRLSGSTMTYAELLFRLEADQETLDNVINRPECVTEVLPLLEKIRQNGSNIPTEYAPRRKADYDAFYSSMVSLNVQASILAKEFNLPRNPNFLRDISSNQRLFYVSGESRRSTGYAGIAGKRVQLAQVENGLKYQLYLRSKGVSREQGRIFL